MKSVITIGRSTHCDIIVPDNNVSREHARLSVVNGQYVYEDVSRNGSVIGGIVINGRKIAVAPGTEILLAGRIPLPWNKVYSLIPLHGSNIYEEGTVASRIDSTREIYNNYSINTDENLGIGWGLLAFFIPIAGWIMYFIWKDDYHKKALQASILAWISFIISLIALA